VEAAVFTINLELVGAKASSIAWEDLSMEAAYNEWVSSLGASA
jgi:hypothetical protein